MAISNSVLLRGALAASWSNRFKKMPFSQQSSGSFAWGSEYSMIKRAQTFLRNWRAVLIPCAAIVK